MRVFKRTKQDKLSLAGLAIVVIPIVLSIFTPEVRNFFGIEEMNGKQIIAFLFYVSSCIFTWQYILWPAIRTEITAFNQPSHEEEKRLHFSNISIKVSPDGKVTLRTAINIIEGGIKRPLSKLRPKNFLITEESLREKRGTNILQVKPMISPVRIIVLIDNSSSMWGETEFVKYGEKIRKIENVKEAILKFTNDIIYSKISSVDSKPSVISFLPFSSEGLYFLTRKDDEIWFPTLPESSEEISQAINSITPNGRTPMNDGILHSLETLSLFDDEKYGIIFCLTDGIDNDSEISNTQLLESLKKYNIPVITAGYGSDNEIDEDYLLKIALDSGAGKENSGAFFNMSPEKLSKVFEKVSRDLNHMYEISWYSAFSTPGDKVLSKIQASYVSATGRRVSPVIEKAYFLP